MISEELKTKINLLISSLIEKSIDNETIKTVVKSIVKYRQNEIHSRVNDETYSRENAVVSSNKTVNIFSVSSLSNMSVVSREVEMLQKGADNCSTNVDARRFLNSVQGKGFLNLNSRLFYNIGMLCANLSSEEMKSLMSAIKNKTLVDETLDSDLNLSSSSSSFSSFSQ